MLADRLNRKKVWTRSRARLLQMLHQSLNLLNIKLCRFTLGCLRPGGATQFFREGMEIARLKFKGRWASESSMGCYVQECRSQLVLHAISKSDGSILGRTFFAVERPALVVLCPSCIYCCKRCPQLTLVLQLVILARFWPQLETSFTKA